MGCRFLRFEEVTLPDGRDHLRAGLQSGKKVFVAILLDYPIVASTQPTGMPVTGSVDTQAIVKEMKMGDWASRLIPPFSLL